MLRMRPPTASARNSCRMSAAMVRRYGAEIRGAIVSGERSGALFCGQRPVCGNAKYTRCFPTMSMDASGDAYALKIWALAKMS